MADPIFHDPTGRRARRVRFMGGLVASAIALLVAGFFATLGAYLDQERPAEATTEAGFLNVVANST